MRLAAGLLVRVAANIHAASRAIAEPLFLYGALLGFFNFFSSFVFRHGASCKWYKGELRTPDTELGVSIGLIRGGCVGPVWFVALPIFGSDVVRVVVFGVLW
jgi:hypothetical protein